MLLIHLSNNSSDFSYREVDDSFIKNPKKIEEKNLLEWCTKKNLETENLYTVNFKNEIYISKDLGPDFSTSIFEIEEEEVLEIAYCKETCSYYEVIMQVPNLKETCKKNNSSENSSPKNSQVTFSKILETIASSNSSFNLSSTASTYSPLSAEPNKPVLITQGAKNENQA